MSAAASDDLATIKRALGQIGLLMFPGLRPDNPLHGSSNEQARIRRLAPDLASLAVEALEPPIERRGA